MDVWQRLKAIKDGNQLTDFQSLYWERNVNPVYHNKQRRATHSSPILEAFVVDDMTAA